MDTPNEKKMEQKHTPGPWLLIKGTDSTFPNVRIRNCNLIVATGIDIEDEANAELIARAPELLERVSALTKRLEDVIKVKDELYYKCEALTEQVEKLKERSGRVTYQLRRLIYGYRVSGIEALKSEEWKMIYDIAEMILTEAPYENYSGINAAELFRLREERNTAIELLKQVLHDDVINYVLTAGTEMKIKDYLSKFPEVPNE